MRTPRLARRASMPAALALVALISVTASAQAQRVPVASRPGGVPQRVNYGAVSHPPIAGMNEFLGSVEVSVNGSPYAAQVVASGTPAFGPSAPGARANVTVSVRWTPLPVPPTQQGITQPPTPKGYIILRATRHSDGRTLWDSVGFANTSPASVQAQLSPASNALFRVAPVIVETSISHRVTSSASVPVNEVVQTRTVPDTSKSARVITP